MTTTEDRLRAALHARAAIETASFNARPVRTTARRLPVAASIVVAASVAALVAIGAHYRQPRAETPPAGIQSSSDDAAWTSTGQLDFSQVAIAAQPETPVVETVTRLYLGQPVRVVVWMHGADICSTWQPLTSRHVRHVSCEGPARPRPPAPVGIMMGPAPAIDASGRALRFVAGCVSLDVREVYGVTSTGQRLPATIYGRGLLPVGYFVYDIPNGVSIDKTVVVDKSGVEFPEDVSQ